MDSFVDIDKLSFGQKFVHRFPIMFTEDKEWWARELDKFHKEEIISVMERLRTDNEIYINFGEPAARGFFYKTKHFSANLLLNELSREQKVQESDTTEAK